MMVIQDIDHAADVDFLTSEVDRIKRGVETLQNAYLKHAIKSLSIGSSLYRRKKSK